MKNPLHWLQLKRAPRGAQWKRLGLLVLLIAIGWAAHGNSFALWRALAPFGLDVAITPFTTDMMFMESVGESSKRRLFLSAQSLNGRVTLPVSELGFYDLKMPLLLLFDLHSSGADVSGHQEAVCRSLKRRLGTEVQSWSLLGHPHAKGRWACLGQ